MSCWLAIEGKVYDVTRFLASHPGGEKTVLRMGGLDATDVFLGYHGAATRAWLPPYYIGEVAAEDLARSQTPCTLEYRALRASLEAEGAFETRASFYAVHVAWVLSLLASACVLTARAQGDAAQTLLGALVLGIFWQQCAFLGHDLGHNAVTHVRRTDAALGLVFGNLLTGISITWWKATHNAHHLSTNSVTHDPDIQHMPLLAISADFFRSPFSWYHHRELTYDWVARLTVQFQHWVFYPLMSVARWNLYGQSAQLLLLQARVENRALELAALLGYFLWLATLLSTVPGFPLKFAFLYVSHAVVGLLHVQICLSHFSREVCEGRPMDQAGESFFRTQLAASLDVDCWSCLDWLHGGLQFQSIHHLFPRLPRHRLRALVPAVRELAIKHGADYRSATFWAANVALVDTLRRTAGESTSFNAGLIDGLNATG